MFGKLLNEISFLREIWRVGISSVIEYRISFIVQVFSTFINDIIYFVFWLLFFNKFQSVAGYGFKDMLLQFSIVTTGFGLAFSLFGNVSRISYLITQGLLDNYLSMPRNILLHVLSSRFSISPVGDLIFGIMVFFFVGKLTIINIFLWILTSILVAIIFIMFYVIIGSTAFWLGNSEGIVDTIGGSLVTFSLYPSSVFQGISKFLLYTLIPAGFLGIIPVKIVNEKSSQLILGLIIYTIFLSFLAIKIFYSGLKRYESGSSININS